MSKSQQLRRIEDLFFNLNYDSKYYGECWHHAIAAYHDQLGTEGVLGQITEQGEIEFRRSVSSIGTLVDFPDGRILGVIK